jgi:GntR family transcriptional regulator
MKTKFHFQAVPGAGPLYRQVAEYLKELIVSGDIAYGERLPSEQELAELLSVSRLTLRKGLSILIAQNLIFQTEDRSLLELYRCLFGKIVFSVNR